MKNHQVVILPAYGKTKIGDFVLGLVNGENQRLFFGKKVQDAVNCAETNFHLYILSDEVIKKGDWYINNKVLFKADDKFDEGNNPNQNKNNKKIIATTDRSLCYLLEPHKDRYGDMRYNKFHQLPQPSQEFIKHFVEEYNKGNVIAEVGVEYENEDMDFDPAEPNGINWVKKLKINPDNTINTKPKKESWSREEVIGLIKKIKEI